MFSGLNGGANEDATPTTRRNARLIRAGDDEQGVYLRARSMPASDSSIIRARSNKPFFFLEIRQIGAREIVGCCSIKPVKKTCFQKSFRYCDANLSTLLGLSSNTCPSLFP
ncbi:hypothetical protein CDAR_34631 [Caerostris darwini]|uniref:Uncharacterized protein n=1 Tax=Caerostris darwini TaxID=1538125 RepID=A0AAV4QCX6_9ARAC|nr:hypothetical protein CDAR_34631 [Caerostris darwini]